MRLLTVTHFYEEHGGGIERVAGQLNRQLKALGHETIWAASESDTPPAPDTAEPVPLRCVNTIERLTGLPMPIPSPGALRRLGRAVAECDAVIIHDALYATSVAALRAARRRGKPVLLVQHIAAIPFRSRIMRGVMGLANRMVSRPMLKAADQVIFISGTTAAYFEGVRFRRPPVLAFNGVDVGLFRPAGPGEKAAARAAHALAADGPVALFVGRFVEKKGLNVLRALAAARPDVLFVLAGGGPIDPAGWGLSNVAVRQGLAGERLASLYRAADAFVLPSVGEGYPLVVQEALASGLPILCGAESARADPAAAPFLTGLPVDLNRPEATATAFATALDAALAAPANPGAAVFARDRYSWEGVARRYEAAIRALT
ncbi:MAG TPA: glycosyltransferase family 4 protein [Allosphingosinicella sp.]|nr:glycosyltransferase family 4 protein [Allosphingosinicella sp.]